MYRIYQFFSHSVLLYSFFDIISLRSRIISSHFFLFSSIIPFIESKVLPLLLLSFFTLFITFDLHFSDFIEENSETSMACPKTEWIFYFLKLATHLFLNAVLLVVSSYTAAPYVDFTTLYRSFPSDILIFKY